MSTQSRYALSLDQFTILLKNVYYADPCGTLSIPLWKMLSMLEGCQLRAETDAAGAAVCLEAWNDTDWLLYWHRDAQWDPGAPEKIRTQPRFVVMHSRYASHFRLNNNYVVERYFRLRAEDPVQARIVPANFRFHPVIVPDEVESAANVMCRCYRHLQPSSEEVLSWTHRPVFDPGLWLWVMDERINQPAGLGIAELDREAEEASLEWIQVLPEYRGTGLGKALVMQLASRVSGVRVVTVSGECDNPWDPESLYRGCGFSGNDVWLVIRQIGG